MKEIGGYIELDTYRLPMLHEGAIALNCGRNALAYLLRARHVKKLWIPEFICDSVMGVCEREDVPYTQYDVGLDFRPLEEIRLEDGEWLFFVNFYSQFGNDQIAEYVHRYGRIIVDNAQSYFQPPLPHVDTLYTCRKYFGVADGAFLYTDAKLPEALPIDESFERMRFLLGRFERSASEFYAEYTANNKFFVKETIKRMSKLTDNLLHGIDYKQVMAVRQRNFTYLHHKLRPINGLKLSWESGTFMYPLLLENGAKVRKRLQAEKIYIPTLWPNVINTAEVNTMAYKMAENILPLPIDQRYSLDDMNTILEGLLKCMKI